MTTKTKDPTDPPVVGRELLLGEAVTQFLNEKQRGFAHNRSETIGASEIGACARKVWYEKHLGSGSYDPAKKSASGAGFRGDIIEEHWTTPIVKKWAVANGAKLIWAGNAGQRTITVPNWRASCTPDGLIIDAPSHLLAQWGVLLLPGSSVVVEMKSYDPRKEEKLPIAKHLDQALFQMGLIRAEGNYFPQWAIVVYVNASFLDDIRVFPVRYDEARFKNQIIRAQMLFTAPSADVVRPEGIIAGQSECTNECPFTHLCNGYRPWVPNQTKSGDEIGNKDMAKIAASVGTIMNMRRQITELDARVSEAEAQLKETLARVGSRHAEGELLDGRKYRVAWTRTNGRKSFDTMKAKELLQAAGTDPDTLMKTGKPGEMLTVKWAPGQDTSPRNIPAMVQKQEAKKAKLAKKEPAQ